MPTFAYETKLGSIAVEENDGCITNVFLRGDAVPKNDEWRETELIKEAHRQLTLYLDGKLKQFDLPLAPRGTDFMKRVYKCLCEIPYGATQSYGELAAKLDNPKAARAVGNANNKNPIPIFIPCHRVIGANGKLVGYRGGLALKEALLALEKEGLHGVF